MPGIENVYRPLGHELVVDVVVVGQHHHGVRVAKFLFSESGPLQAGVSTMTGHVQFGNVVVDITDVRPEAQKTMSLLDIGTRQIRKGAADSVKRWVVESGGPRRRPTSTRSSNVSPVPDRRPWWSPTGRTSSASSS